MSFKSDPYKLFFPIAILSGIWASVFWILNYFHFANYPGREHALLMIGGFFLSAVAGFLMTATPRFTQTYSATITEKSILLSVFLMLPFSTFFTSPAPSLILVLIALLVLSFFFFRRYLNRKNEPAKSFLIIGYAFICAVISLGVMILHSQSLVNAEIGKLGRYFFLHTFPLMIILGVGSQILVAFNGWNPQVVFPCYLKWFDAHTKVFFNFIGLGLIFGTILSQYFHLQVGEFLTSSIVIFIALLYWRILSIPPMKTKFSKGIWVSQWSLVLGIVGATVFPNYSIHFFHLYSIGGIGLMTLLIATRVVAAHGGYNVGKINQSKVIYWVVGLGIFSALTRLSAGLIPSTYFSHLFYASTLWIVTLGLWFYEFGLKIWKQSGASSC